MQAGGVQKLMRCLGAAVMQGSEGQQMGTCQVVWLVVRRIGLCCCVRLKPEATPASAGHMRLPANSQVGFVQCCSLVARHAAAQS
jgi:hypothetical protein